MLAIDKLLDTDPFLLSSENKKLFVESVSEAALAHCKGSEAFRAFWKAANLHPEEIKGEEDLKRIPPIMVHLFKEKDWISVSREEIVLTLTSSGTSGQKSQMFLDKTSLDRVKKLAFQIHKSLGITSDDNVNYLCFTYDPKVAKDLGTAFTDELLTSFTQIKNVYYAFQWNTSKKDFVYEPEKTLQVLKKYQLDGAPVRILGFPAFLYKLLKDTNESFHLGEKSWVQTGGGWKNFSDEQIPKTKFREVVSQRLGIPLQNIRDMFGMVEHGIPYCDCSLGNLHVPNYSRVFIRSPKNLEILPEGEMGLIQFLCSYNTSYPTMSLLTTDWGKLSRCDCGIEGCTLEILGRAGVQKHKGCAIQAQQLVK